MDWTTIGSVFCIDVTGDSALVICINLPIYESSGILPQLCAARIIYPSL